MFQSADDGNAIEKRLWKAADTLRANSNLASNEYFLPVMGLLFLRHAYNRYLSVKAEIEKTLPQRNGVIRSLTKEDFSRKTAIFLKDTAQFDYLVSLPDKEDRAQAISGAMESIETDYDSLSGILPKNEYQQLDNKVIGHLLRILNPDELKKASGDVFGKIYEYFLAKFSDQKAHDDGEFFTPLSLVSLIANVLEPNHGTVLDPACGSGGMFVQSAHFVERIEKDPGTTLTFRGLEKNNTTIRLAKMNLAVHGLTGDIRQAITYYQDPHELFGKADYVMANPPFNVDEIDAENIKKDPRLSFGLPGVNKQGKVSNGNYVWINYFYSYLNDRGRAGFVMSSQASSAGGKEALVRKKLIESGAVDVMISIRSNFFYTRTVPCELWFLDRGKPEAYKDKVLMLDARNIYRMVTRKIYDFSPEQQQNILAIIWLYRGQNQKFLDLVAGYCQRMLAEGRDCFGGRDQDGNEIAPLPDFIGAVDKLRGVLQPFFDTLDKNASHAETLQELDYAVTAFKSEVEQYRQSVESEREKWKDQSRGNGALKAAVDRLASLAETSRDLVKQADLIYKLASRLIDILKSSFDVKASDKWNNTEISRANKAADQFRQVAVEQLKLVRYFQRQAHWLTERFPEGKYCDVEGLVRLVDYTELEANDWSLTPGRYVGVAPEVEVENFDFEETMREIHVELNDLNSEAAELAMQIKKNFEELGI